MKHACLVPATHHDDLAGAMSMTLRTKGIDVAGPLDDVEDRAFEVLFRTYSYAEIKKHLPAAIATARELGPIDLEGASA